jgi:UDP-N-acetylmuramate dehydrogenase
LNLLENISLKDFTTIQTGGPARFFLNCKTDEEIKQALTFSKSKNIPTFTLGGGSNLLVSDAGFSGLVLQVATESLSIESDGRVRASSGINWDQLVMTCCQRGLSGLEALSGIPGRVGATPIQNVGAYGQEVSNVIDEVCALEKTTLRSVTFKSNECQFDYRQSRFKCADFDKFIITSVTFQLSRSTPPQLAYEELITSVESDPNWLGSTREQKILLAREHVLGIRAKKGMVLNSNDPDTRSVGSFFVNPVVSQSMRDKLAEDASKSPNARPFIAHRVSANMWKLSAAWLIENAGIKKGQSLGGASISSKHVLALTNAGNASTRDILALADVVTQAVKQKYGILLEREPVFIGDTTSL